MHRVLLMVLCAAALQACVSVRSNHGYVLERDQEELNANVGLDTKESVLAKYGEPSMIGAFDRNSWYYLNSSDQARAFFRPKVNAREVVAFQFSDDGKVKDVRRWTMEDAKKIKMVSRTTPTRGRELNFWEQVFGNIGQLPAGLGQEGPVPGQ
ncbi:MAG: outer membrane protein assembly factor BamE [Pseudomonadota bacterium]